MKKFFKKTEGFTLVELIVVIAILGILAGVGTVGYSGYIKKANIAADQQLVAGVKNALELATYDRADPMPATGYVKLSMDAAPEYDENERIGRALTAAFGSDLSNLKLKHKWGNGVAAANILLNVLKGTGTSEGLDAALANIYNNPDGLTFTEEMNDMVGEIRDVSVAVANSVVESGKATDQQILNFLNTAAGITSNIGATAMGDAWAKDRYILGADGKYTDDDAVYNNAIDASEDGATAAIAAMLRARNTCVAMYVAANGYEEYRDILAGYSSENGIPKDLWQGVDGNNVTDLGAKLFAAGANETEIGEMIDLMTEYYNSVDSKGGKVSKNDATAFLTMMNTIDQMGDSSEITKNNLEDYFNSVTGPVDMFQQMVKGSTSLTDLETSLENIGSSSENTVVLMVIGDKITSSVKVDG